MASLSQGTWATEQVSCKDRKENVQAGKLPGYWPEALQTASGHGGGLG